MTTDEDARKKDVARVLEETLNTHGYGFQHAVIRRVEELAEAHKSQWLFEAAELPVEGGPGTRIDLVLQRRRNPESRTSAYYMLGECKRANPAFSDWCFVRAPYTLRNPKDGHVLFDRIRQLDNGTFKVGPVEQYMGSEKFSSYHIAFDVKGRLTGDRQGSGKGAIEEGATQILRGLNGMLHFLAAHPDVFSGYNRSVTLVPVIFTTAQLWVLDNDLGAADLHSGNVSFDLSQFRKKDWLLYEYNQSPGLKHSLPPADREAWQGQLRDIIEHEYVRTIPIVSPDGLNDFLDWSHRLETR